MLSDNISSSTESSDDERQQKHSSSKIDKPLVPRPNASPGYWVACLLPLAMAVQYLPKSKLTNCSQTSTYNTLTISAVGMCVESLCFFMYLALNTGLWLKLIISFVPGLVTSCLFAFLQGHSARYSIFWGFATTFCYQSAYIRVMRGLPRCFSYGEAALLVQGLILFIVTAALQLPDYFTAKEIATITYIDNEYDEAEEFKALNGVMLLGLFSVLVCCWLLTKCKWLRRTYPFYLLLTVTAACATCLPITQPIPLFIVLKFILADTGRIFITIYYEVLAAFTTIIVCWQLYCRNRATTSVRKIFHVFIVLVYVPGAVDQCTFLYLATGVALAILTLLELFRILEIPPLWHTLKNAFAAFADEKDAGALALTPFSLLIGCSLPFWIHPCPCSGLYTQRLLPLLAGVFTVGIGDTAASVVGSICGKTKWPNSQRSFEGTVAFIISVLGVVWFFSDQYADVEIPTKQNLAVLAATLTSAFVEAFTDQIDNLVLPLVFYIIVSLV